ncbi:MAG: hypothetical protein O7D86_14205 [Proteobacteria bacterium]|nr:hypothetical protein [Pseudomonadota bacterium]
MFEIFSFEHYYNQQTKHQVVVSMKTHFHVLAMPVSMSEMISNNHYVEADDAPRFEPNPVIE